jgi:hypothetical protein
MNKLDPRVKSNPDTAAISLTSARGATHGGRDAPVGASLTGAGYEAEGHHPGTNDENLPNFHHFGRDASAIGAATVLDENEKARLRAVRGEHDNNYGQGLLKPRYGSAAFRPTNNQCPYEPGYSPITLGLMDKHSRHHHLGRDAAAASATGGAVYEAEKQFKHDRDLTPSEREQK